MGVQGSETVDWQAGASLSLEPNSFRIPFSSFEPSINGCVLEEWRTSWNNSIGGELLDMEPIIGDHQSVVRSVGKEEVVLARLRLGHARVQESHNHTCCWVGSSRSVLVAMRHSLCVASFWSVAI